MGWGEILGNVYISRICCGFVVNHAYKWWGATAVTSVSCKCSKYPTKVCLHATPVRSQIIATLLKSHCVPG